MIRFRTAPGSSPFPPSFTYATSWISCRIYCFFLVWEMVFKQTRVTVTVRYHSLLVASEILFAPIQLSDQKLVQRPPLLRRCALGLCHFKRSARVLLYSFIVFGRWWNHVCCCSWLLWWVLWGIFSPWSALICTLILAIVYASFSVRPYQRPWCPRL